MKKLVEHVKTHRKIVHAHLKKHHKKYFLWIISAALLIKIIPAFIAWLATWHFNYSFADDNPSKNSWVHEEIIDWVNTLTVCDPNDDSACITIMDRNLWATTNDINSTGSYWYHYQWWNNHGFLSCYEEWCTDFPWWESTTNVQIDSSLYWPWNRFNSWIFFVDEDDWSNPSNDNLRWWWDDEINNYEYPIDNYDERQWPCETWYHVPSESEWSELLLYWVAHYTWMWNELQIYSSDYANLISFSASNNLSNNVSNPLQNTLQAINKFQQDFKIPPAGWRSMVDGLVWDDIALRSSSPNSDTSFAMIFGLIYIEDIAWIYTSDNSRAFAYPIRCFKNTPVIIEWDESWDSEWDTETWYTITYTDGVENEEVFTDQITTWLSIWDDIPGFNWTPTRTWYTFSGWNPEVTGNVSWDQTYTAQWNINNNWWDDNWWDNNWWDNTWWDDDWWDNNWWNNTTSSCSSNNLLITAPISWSHLKSENVRLTWTLSGSACSGETFAIKLYNGNDSGSYTVLWTVSANSGEFSNLENFNISGLVETNFAIYLVEDGEIVESLKEGPTFFIDNIKPEIIDSTYAFNPARTTTYGLNDRVNVSFTGSEELTGITVNVLWRNATFVSRSWLKYNYTIQLSSGNNTWQFGYHISFSDLAGNTWYYEYFNSWLTLDTTKPELSWLQFRRISDKTWFVSFTTTKPSNITFKYVLSWWKATETLTAQNTTGMRSNLVKARTDRTGYIYKYVITLEDLLWNKNYYAGTFQLSGDSLWYTLVTANWDSISNWTTTNILSTLSDEINAFSWCKNSLNMKYKSMQYTVQNRFWFKPEVPTFDDSSVQDTAELLVTLLAGTGWLSKSSITWLTQAKVNSFQEDLNNYLVIIKIKRDPDVCNAHLSLLPSLYMSKFMKTLKSYKLIK